MKIISIYSGCGGLDLGFKKAGFYSLLATDYWDKACQSLIENNMAESVINNDIRKISFNKYKGAVDGIIGGPPCPPYSQTRHYLTKKKSGFKDEGSGYAVIEYFRVVEEVQPKFFLFENVDGFMYKTHKDSLNYFVNRAKELDYNITYNVINAANYGVPQTRKRFFSIGFKRNIGTFTFPLETHTDPMKNINGELNWVTCGDVLSDYDYVTEEEKLQKPGSKHHHLLKDIPPGGNYLFYTKKRGYPEPKFEWKSRYWTFLLKLTPDRPSWTIQASFSNNQGPFHWRNRFLRIEELKRLQTFDDDFNLSGDFKDQWRQIGNAVPVYLSEVLANKIKEQIL